MFRILTAFVALASLTGCYDDPPPPNVADVVLEDARTFDLYGDPYYSFNARCSGGDGGTLIITALTNATYSASNFSSGGHTWTGLVMEPVDQTIDSYIEVKCYIHQSGTNYYGSGYGMTWQTNLTLVHH